MTIATNQAYTFAGVTATVTAITRGPLDTSIVTFKIGGATHQRTLEVFRKWLAGEPLKGKQRMPRPQKRDESKLVKAAIEYLTLMGCFVWRQNQGGMKAQYKGKDRFIRFAHVDGISDVIGMTPTGRFIAVECKVKGNTTSDDQDGFLERVRRNNGIAIVCYDLDELEEQYKRQA